MGRQLEEYENIYFAIKDKGSLKFNELTEVFGVSERDLLGIESRLKKENPSVIRKGKEYQIKDYNSSNATTEPHRKLEILDYEWEKEGSRRLSEILKDQDLKKILKGELGYAFRQLRDYSFGEKISYNSKQEKADILILEYGRDLFSEKSIREAVGKRFNISDIPQSWRSASFSARKFVDKVGFPKEFYGIQENKNKPRKYEFFDQRKFHKLVDFQEELKQKMEENLVNKKNKFLLSLPTGGGKTKTAVHFILDHLNKSYQNKKRHILWLAHTEELCEQAYDCFRQTSLYLPRHYDIGLFRYWGNYASEDILNFHETRKNCPFISISTPQKINNILNSNSADPIKLELIHFFKKNLVMLCIDEAHRSASNTYKNIAKELSEKNRDLAILGLTATPFRKEYDDIDPDGGTEDLVRIFEKNLVLPTKTLGSDSKKSLQKRDYLCRLEKVKIDTKMNIPFKEKYSHEDFSKAVDQQIQKRADRHKRRCIILKAIKKEIKKYPNGKFLYFGATVNDVKLMTALLRSEKFDADYVVGDRKKSTRKRIINDFKSGQIQFLCSCEVLTTGFDEPQITHLVMGRPTVSQVLYEQMIGRGLRGIKFGGTEKCRVLSCEDIKVNYDKFYDIWKNENIKPKEEKFINENIKPKEEKFINENIKPKEEYVKVSDFKKTLYVKTLLSVLYAHRTISTLELEILSKNARADLNESDLDIGMLIQREKESLKFWFTDFSNNLDKYTKGLSYIEKRHIFRRAVELVVCNKKVYDEECDFLLDIQNVFKISEKDRHDVLEDNDFYNVLKNGMNKNTKIKKVA